MHRNPPTGLPDPEFQPEFYAGIPAKRLIAWIVDAIVVLVLTLLAVPLTAFVALFFLPMFFIIVDFTYRTVTLAGRSATPGMRLVAIELRDRDGNRLDAGTAAVHTVGYMVSMSMVLLQIVSVVLMLVSPRAQGLTDTVLGSAAINRPGGPA